jgi:GT2 family glycosyltransferase
MKSVSIVIPNYNGLRLLEENLPILFRAMEGLETRREVIVVDDCSTDASVAFLEEHFPKVTVVKTKTNSGFGAACNLGVKNSTCEIIYLLNSDVKVRGGFLENILGYFDDTQVFGISSLEISGGVERVEMPKFFFRSGVMLHRYEPVDVKGAVIPAIFVSGGHSAFDRVKFLELGGFRDIYNPFLWEDMDICYRAWKRGWRSFYSTKSLVVHDHGQTINKTFAKSAVSGIHWRNRFLFIWANMGGVYLARNFVMLPIFLAGCLFMGKFEVLDGFFKALPRMSRALSLNKEWASSSGDSEIFTRFEVGR